MKFLSACFSLCLSLSIHAQVSQGEVSQMLDKMVKEGTISAPEAAKAKLKLQGMNAEQWEKVNGEAAKIATRSPASVNGKMDLDGAQIHQIQNDIKKIIPEIRR